jgi:hypothetical protein
MSLRVMDTTVVRVMRMSSLASAGLVRLAHFTVPFLARDFALAYSGAGE